MAWSVYMGWLYYNSWTKVLHWNISTMSGERLSVLNVAKLKRLSLFIVSSLPLSLSLWLFFSFRIIPLHSVLTHISMQIFIKTFFIYWPQYAPVPGSSMCASNVWIMLSWKLVATVTCYADWCLLAQTFHHFYLKNFIWLWHTENSNDASTIKLDGVCMCTDLCAVWWKNSNISI